MWCYVRFQEAFACIISFNLGTTSRGSKWRVHAKDEVTAEGQTEKRQSQDANLDLPPPRSEHFPMHPNFEKYYYWLQHCSTYLLNTQGRGGGGKDGASGREESF